MSFGYDAENTGMEPLKAGEYEVYPTTYESKLTSKTRNPMIVMNYKVRSDVDQPNKGALIQYDNFVESPKSQWRFNALTKATDMYENGHDFGTMESWAEEMLGKPVRVKVKVEPSQNGKEYPSVSSFKKSDVPTMTETPQIKSHKDINDAANSIQNNMPPANDPFADGGQSIDISDEDVPF